MPENMQEPLSPPPSIPAISNPLVVTSEDEEDAIARLELARITPSNEKLREMARKCGPPPEYFEGEEEMPFEPVQE